MTPDPKKVVILSIPHCEPFPMVAPVLLSACLNQAGIPARGIDFAFQFLEKFAPTPYWLQLKHHLLHSWSGQYFIEPSAFRAVYKFTKRFLNDVMTKHNPEYIGVSIFSTDSMDFGLFMAYMIRRHFPQVKIIAGGKGLEVPHLNKEYHYEMWNRYGIADIIVIGDAELEIIDSIQQGKTGIVFAKQQTQEDLDNIPLVNWSDYDTQKYPALRSYADTKQTASPTALWEPYIAVTASKGCVRKCTFCDVAKFWPKYIWRTPAKVAREIIHNYQHTGIEKFHFTDNLVNGSITHYREMNQILAAEIPRKIRYQGYAIFRGKDQMPEDDFRLAADAGCVKWVVGVESGSERIRNHMGKKFSNSDLDWSIEMLVKYGIDQVWLLMVGYPSETDEDFQETLNLLRKYKDLGASGRVQIGLTPTFMLTPNAPLLSDPDLANVYGLSHNLQNESYAKFWTSTHNPGNTYDVRSNRYKQVVDTVEQCGYSFHAGTTPHKSLEEIKNLDKAYDDQKTKIIPILATS